MSKLSKILLIASTFILLEAASIGLARASVTTAAMPDQGGSCDTAGATIIYRNDQYGFLFSLPRSWQGYTVLTQTWQGMTVSDKQGEKLAASGPIVVIRSPKWTADNPTQDIPIMVFTLDQWSRLQNDEFHIGAAPIGPSELGRNSRYVFALPARYNFAFLPGWEEVQAIIDSKPLQGFD